MWLRGSCWLWFAIVLCASFASAAHAQTAWDEHAGVRLDVTLGLSPTGRYDRYHQSEAQRTRIAWGTSADLAVHYVFRSAFGIGGHAGASLVSVSQPALDNHVFLLDLGPSLLARLAWKEHEVTLRIPFGLTLGSASGSSRVMAGSDAVRRYTTSDELGLGVHASLLVGTVHWLSRSLAVRVEAGPSVHSVTRDEAFGVYALGMQGPLVAEETREVLDATWDLSVRLGVTWGGTR